MSSRPASDTANLYRSLLQRADAPAPAALLRAAADLASQQDDAGAKLLRSDLLARSDAPLDFLAEQLRSRVPETRATAMCHPSLPVSAKVTAVRTERSPIVLKHVARRSADTEVLAQVIGKRGSNENQATFVTHLLGNDHSDLATLTAAVVWAQTLLGDPQQWRSQALTDAVSDAIAGWIGLGSAVLPHATSSWLVVAAACGGRLDAPEWAQVAERLIDEPLAALTPGETLPGSHIDALWALLRVTSMPQDVQTRVAHVLLEHAVGRTHVLDRCRQILARADQHRDGADYLRLAREATEAEQVALALAAPHTGAEVAYAVATNAAVDDKTFTAALRQLAARGDLHHGVLVACGRDVARATTACHTFGPGSLALLEPWLLPAVLVGVLAQVAAAPRPHLSVGRGPREQWSGLVDQLITNASPSPDQEGAAPGFSTVAATAAGDEVVVVPGLADWAIGDLPWPLVTQLVEVFPSVASWLIDQISAAVAGDGAARVFDAVQQTYTGPVGVLLAGLAGATQTRPVSA